MPKTQYISQTNFISCAVDAVYNALIWSGKPIEWKKLSRFMNFNDNKIASTDIRQYLFRLQKQNKFTIVKEIRKPSIDTLKFYAKKRKAIFLKYINPGYRNGHCCICIGYKRENDIDYFRLVNSCYKYDEIVSWVPAEVVEEDLKRTYKQLVKKEFDYSLIYKHVSYGWVLGKAK